MTPSELCVPLKSLAIPGEAGADVPPAQGEEVEFSGKATVARIDGEMAYLTPTEINGQPVEAPAKELGMDDEEAELRGEAAATDRKAGLFN